MSQRIKLMSELGLLIIGFSILFTIITIWYFDNMPIKPKGKLLYPHVTRIIQPVRFYIRCPRCRYFFGNTHNVVVIKEYEVINLPVKNK